MIRNRFRLSGLDVIPVRWPLRWTFSTALGAKSSTDNVIVRVRLSGGAEGYGEASSSIAMAFQTQAGMAASLRNLGRTFRGEDVRDAESLIERVWRKEGRRPTAAAAFEVALWDALARACGTPFAALWGGPVRREIRTTLSVPCGDPESVFNLVRRFARKGFGLFKIKMNGRDPLETNLERFAAARRAAPRARFLLDPNQSYAPEKLLEFLSRASRAGLEAELVEEPFLKRNWTAYSSFPRRWKSRSVSVILDESVQTSEDAERVVRLGISNGVNVKLAKSGILKSGRILEKFKRPELRGRKPVENSKPNPVRPSPLFMIGCMAESKIGLSAAVHWACARGDFDYVDLDSDLFVAAPGVRGGYERRGPVVVLPRRPPPGLGVVWGRP